MALFERPKPQMGTQGDVLVPRIIAAVIDVVVLFVVIGLVGFAVSQVSTTLSGVVGLVLSFGYFIYFEGTYGQTLGKMVMDVVVVTEKGDPCNYQAAAIRTLIRIIDSLPFLYIVGLAAIFLTDSNQRLGDMAADTVVVRSRERGAQL